MSSRTLELRRMKRSSIIFAVVAAVLLVLFLYALATPVPESPIDEEEALSGNQISMLYPNVKIAGNGTCDFTELHGFFIVETDFICYDYAGIVEIGEKKNLFEGQILEGTFSGELSGEIQEKRFFGHLDGTVVYGKFVGTIAEMPEETGLGIPDWLGSAILVIILIVVAFLIYRKIRGGKTTVQVGGKPRNADIYDRVFRDYMFTHYGLELVMHYGGGGVVRDPDSGVVSALYMIDEPNKLHGKLVKVYEQPNHGIFFKIIVGEDEISQLHETPEAPARNIGFPFPYGTMPKRVRNQLKKAQKKQEKLLKKTEEEESPE